MNSLPQSIIDLIGFDTKTLNDFVISRRAADNVQG